MTEGTSGDARAALTGWTAPDSEICQSVEERSRRRLSAYREHPDDIEEHANIERSITEGGYGRRQVYELVQNGADALLESGTRGRIHVVLTRDAMYCANEGAPITVEGVGAMLGAYVSRKRGREIGRFGLGFKSVLSVTRNPYFFSRSGSFAFSEEAATTAIREVHPDAEAFPVLRTAFPCSATSECMDDADLASLAEWASTVVKLPRNVEMLTDLSDDLAKFPSEFLLFCPHVSTVTLEDRTRSSRREIRLSVVDGRYELRDGEDTGRWRVFDKLHRPSERASRDAGELAGREELLLSWAVPVGGRRRRGEFWAYFPTEDATTLSGIANAPWKTNEDRQSLLVGTFNDELLKAFAGLVTESLPVLLDPEDPASYLDLLPARGREADRWADEWMTYYVYAKATRVPSLPDQAGCLQPSEDLSLHPPGLPPEALEQWAAAAARPDDWCHRSVERRDRRSRAEQLMKLGGGVVQGLGDWIEALVPRAEPALSRDALAVVAQLSATHPEVRSACVLLTSEGRLTPPDPERVFIATDFATSLSGVAFVHPELAGDPAGRAALSALGITRLDAVQELRAVIDRPTVDWEVAWRLIDAIPSEAAIEIVSSAGIVPAVMTQGGAWQAIDEVFLPGEVVLDGEAPEVTIDTRHHADSLDVLRGLGAVASPSADGGTEKKAWFDEYVEWALDEYARERPGARRASLQIERLAFPGPMSPLVLLSGPLAARLTESLLEYVSATAPWRMTVSGRTDSAVLVDAPGWWYLRRHGRFATSRGVWNAARCLAPGLAEWSSFLPVTGVLPDAAKRLGMIHDLEELGDQDWMRAFLRAEKAEEESGLATFYAAAAEHTEPPSRLRCRRGEGLDVAPPSKVTVVTRATDAVALGRAGVPYLKAPDPRTAGLLEKRWGLLPSTSSVQRDVVHVASAAEQPLLDVYPALRRHLSDEHRNLTLQVCSQITDQTLTASGLIEEPITLAVEDGVVFASDGLSDTEVLVGLGREIGRPITEAIATEVLKRRASRQRRQRLEAARGADDDAVRLLAVVEEAVLRSRLPEGLIESVEQKHGPAIPEKVAEMALAVHGVEVLREFRSELERVGLEPPLRWAGSRQALEFVRDLGFGPEYAGTPGARRDPYLDVERPPPLPALHDFQRDITDRLKDVVVGRQERRGLLSMPTGAGKTRVAVHGVVEHFAEDPGPLVALWVAQKDELCEQAVQTWGYVWREIGPRGRPMRVSRLWGGNEAEPFPDGPHVVVASIQKLGRVIDETSYEWLSRADLLIIDEAHGSTEPSYTALLGWLGITPHGATRCPMIGLTATPFRGINEAETKRLAGRYGRYRIDHGVLAQDPYPDLQRMGVLARARHQVLDGARFSMTTEEVELARKLQTLPSSVEAKLGTDAARNRRILDSIGALPDDWTVLLFATSVAHAQTVAALLVAEGIPARAVWGGTEGGTRRRYVDDFRNGRLRVLTNYGVFTEGFDAPAVRAVYVTRPTFSPNLYQQMIGRGLRGPLNGGKPECLVVDVADNVELFGLRLAFQDFDHVWRG